VQGVAGQQLDREPLGLLAGGAALPLIAGHAGQDVGQTVGVLDQVITDGVTVGFVGEAVGDSGLMVPTTPVRDRTRPGCAELVP
jgi:hypothetical protein